MAWLTGYTYRVKGSVVATAAGAQTNFQLKLLVGESSGASGENVDCGEGCQDFPNDIRFTGADGQAKHDYWVESLTGVTPNRLATIWIEVATIPASGSVDFYMYYGKAADAGESSGDNTFVLYNMADIKAFYQMDEASWGTMADETGVNDGTPSGGVTTVADGKFNRGGYFDGSNDYVDCGSNASLNITDVISIEAWAKFLNASESFVQLIIGKPHWDYAYTLFKDDSGSGNFIKMEIHDGARYAASFANLSTDWIHIVGTFDGTWLRLYIDGIEVDSNNIGSHTIDSVGTSVRVGGPDGLGWANLRGRLDCVRIYNKVLSPTEVTALHENYMEKMSTYYNVRKWASPDPTWGAWGSEATTGGTRCYAYILG